MKYRLATPKPDGAKGRGRARRALLLYGATGVERGEAGTVSAVEVRRDFAFGPVLGRCEALEGAVVEARRLAGTSRGPLVLVGEPGTGKSLFARAIHYAGPRADEPFVCVNVPAVPPSLLEAELFGHEAGAFVGARARTPGLLELAGKGTVYIDGIDQLPPNLQPKLLRALDERRARRVGGVEEFDVACMVIAGATHALEDDVLEGTFREDLFYRLNGARISLPPLRERGSDLRLLAERFVREAVAEFGLEPKTLSDEAATALDTHPWPGNVRELRTVVQRAALVADGPRILASHLSIRRRRAQSLAADPPVGEITIPPGGLALDRVEKEALRLTLEMTKGNQSAAARTLGVSRPTLLRKARKHGLEALLQRRSPV